jgi:WD40 repeat protein
LGTTSRKGEDGAIVATETDQIRLDRKDGSVELKRSGTDSLPLNDRGVPMVSFNPAKTLLATGNNFVIRLWDASTGEPVSPARRAMDARVGGELAPPYCFSRHEAIRLQIMGWSA